MNHNNKNQISQPWLAITLLNLIIRESDRLFIIGDITEIYNAKCERYGTRAARFWVWGEIIRSFPNFMKNTAYWRCTMFLNYLKISMRNIWRHKGYSLINIVGLAIGICCCLMALIWILDEYSYDKFHTDSNLIFNIRVQEYFKATPNLLAPALAEEIPEIQYAARLSRYDYSLVSRGDKKSYEPIMAADPAFFNIFSFPFAEGNAATSLDNLNSIIISEDVANKFFQDQSAVGQALTLNNSDEFIVTGVLKNIPHNSTLQFDFLVPTENLIRKRLAANKTWAAWNWRSAETYVKVRPGCTFEQLNDKIKYFLQEHTGEDDVLWSVPLSELHFYNSKLKTYVYFFSVIALIILIMASINFINLSMAMSIKKARETGIRKIVGARRINIVSQFLGESVIMSLVGLAVSFGMLEILLPVFNEIMEKNLLIDPLLSGTVFPILICLTIVVGLAAGIYPAIYQSAFSPMTVIKGCFKSGSGGSRLKKSLVVVQFASSIFFIIAALVVSSQMNFLLEKDIGYDKEHIININLRGETAQQYDNLKNELLNNPKIQSVTASTAGFPYWSWTTDPVSWPGKDPNLEMQIAMNLIHYDFIKTFGIKLLEGRSFSPDHPSDFDSGIIINEEMAEIAGLKSAIGAEITLWEYSHRKVIGVMQNFNFEPLNTRIKPLIFLLNRYQEKTDIMSIRIAPGDISSVIGYIEDSWNNANPDYPFNYKFLDEQFGRVYQGLNSLSNIASGFAILVILIGCLGLFGLSSFAARQKTKEIGIRKVLGASVSSIVQLLSREFIFLVTLSNMIAWPLAWYVMNNWLDNFAYHVNIRPGTFIIAGLMTVLIALISVSYQTVTAALTDPVKTLKYE